MFFCVGLDNDDENSKLRIVYIVISNCLVNDSAKAKRYEIIQFSEMYNLLLY